MARFYSNENFPIPVVAALRALIHDDITIHERSLGYHADPVTYIYPFDIVVGPFVALTGSSNSIRLPNGSQI
jgi:hypothetical protein